MAKSKQAIVKEAEAKLLYIRMCAKLTPYEVCIEERVIYVPENELDVATRDLAVQHLCNAENKFHIQSCIPEATYKKDVFDPATRARVQVQKTGVLSRFKVGQLFKASATGNILSIVRTELNKVELSTVSYFDPRCPVKPNLLISETQMQNSLDKGTLETYNQ